MQSVLLSVVGYFYLTGKHGIRVGERVQIGTLTGQVIDLGLVRTHLLELSCQEPPVATGRVVTLANSVVFQASGGVIKQIDGVNLAWHESSVTLPPGRDSEPLKRQLLNAINDVLGGYQEEIFH